MKKLFVFLFLCFVSIGKVSAAEWTDQYGVTWTYGLKDFVDHRGVSLWGAYITAAKGYGSVVRIPDKVWNGYPVLGVGESKYSWTSPFKGDSNITKVIFPSNLIEIGYEAFDDCSSITAVDIPESVTLIGERAFASCNLQSITVPHNVSVLEVQAFSGNFNASSIKVLPINAPETSSLQYSPFDHCGTNEIHVYKTAIGYDVAPWTNKFKICKDIPMTLITNIEVFPKNAKIAEGEEISLSARVTPSNATIKDIVWSSSNEDVLKSLGNGTFEGVSEGYAFARATTDDGTSLVASCLIVVGDAQFVDVTSVAVEPSSVELHKGLTQTLKADVLPIEASIKSVVWSSTNENVVKVDAKGVITAVGIGHAQVTAVSEGNSDVKAVCDVTVKAPLTLYLELNEKDVEMEPYHSLMLRVTPIPSDAKPNVIWSSDNEDVVVVDDKGNVTPVGEGFAVVTAKATDGSECMVSTAITIKHAPYNPYLVARKTGYAYTSFSGYSINFELQNKGKETINVKRVTVKEASTLNTLSSTTDTSLLGTLRAGGSIGLSIKSSSNIDIATEWEYEYKGNLYTFLSYENYKVLAEEVSLNESFKELYLGESFGLTAKIKPNDVSEKNVVWTSSDEKVVTVNQQGVVKSVGEGTATVTATTKDGSKKSASCKVSVVKYDVTGIAFKENHTTLEIGGSKVLDAMVTPSYAYNKNLIWNSNREDVVMVNSKGKIVGISEGEAIVKASSEEHPEVSASIVVKVVPVLIKSITLNHTSYTLDKGENVQLVATLLPENAPNKDVKWSTDNEDVVMVSNSGRCVYISDGTATVTATTCDGSNLSAKCVFNCADGIISITSDSPDLKIFTTNGYRVNGMQNGVNIVRSSNGAVKKIAK